MRHATVSLVLFLLGLSNSHFANAATIGLYADPAGRTNDEEVRVVPTSPTRFVECSEDFALQFGRLDFPPIEATIHWVYTPARQDDTLERASCGETSVHGFRGTVRFDPLEMAWSRVVDPFGFLELYDLTETVVEPGVVSLEFRDPTSLEGVGDTPLLDGHTVTLAFEPLDFGTEVEVEVVDVEVCVSTIGVDDDVPCTWQATSTPDLRGVIRAELSDRDSSFGTLKARYQTKDD